MKDILSGLPLAQELGLRWRWRASQTEKHVENQVTRDIAAAGGYKPEIGKNFPSLGISGASQDVFISVSAGIRIRNGRIDVSSDQVVEYAKSQRFGYYGLTRRQPEQTHLFFKVLTDEVTAVMDAIRPAFFDFGRHVWLVSFGFNDDRNLREIAAYQKILLPGENFYLPPLPAFLQSPINPK